MADDKRLITDVEHQLEDNIILVSKTDLKSHITEVNRRFCWISGYSEKELLGNPHNMVRHPDMPAEAFKDMWSCLKSGKPWLGYVKNRCKNGDYYWVEANVSPIYEEGSITGYLSVRSRPDAKKVREAEALYQKIKAGESRLAPKGFWPCLKSRWRDFSKQKVMFIIALLPIIALSLIYLFEPGRAVVGGLFAAISAYWIGVALWLRKGIFRHLHEARKSMLRMSEGNFNDQYDIRRDDELGQLFQSIKIMQNNMRANVAKERAIVADANRFKQSMDNAQSNVMIVDSNLNITYVNPSCVSLLKKYEERLQEALPQLHVDEILGQNIDFFHKDPSHQRNLIGSLNSTYDTEIKVNGLTFALSASPMFDNSGKKFGMVVEWRDRTEELAVVDEIKQIVSAVKNGDLDQSIKLDNKSGFFLSLCEEVNDMIRVISSSFEDIATVMHSIAHGNLAHKINTERKGTYGEIQDDINITVDNLKQTIDEIIRASDFFRKSSETIVAGNSDLSHRTDEQAATLQETAAAMSQLTDTVKSNAENAQQANGLAVSAQTTAQRGGDVVKQAVVAMEEINKSSEKIDEITGVIDEIAFQTNLLALNASVEAARAGSHGQGFAVVATEVRNLASRSARAAKEIKDLIADSSAKVQNGSQLVLDSGDTLREIVESVSQVGGIISEIATASSEQSVGINEINQAVAQLDDMTQKNAALAESVTASSKQSFSKASEIVELVDFFNTKRAS